MLSGTTNGFLRSNSPTPLSNSWPMDPDDESSSGGDAEDLPGLSGASHTLTSPSHPAVMYCALPGVHTMARIKSPCPQKMWSASASSSTYMPAKLGTLGAGGSSTFGSFSSSSSFGVSSPSSVSVGFTVPSDASSPSSPFVSSPLTPSSIQLPCLSFRPSILARSNTLIFRSVIAARTFPLRASSAIAVMESPLNVRHRVVSNARGHHSLNVRSFEAVIHTSRHSHHFTAVTASTCPARTPTSLAPSSSSGS